MDIVMLAAGTSSRMSRTNKMLLPYKGMSLVTHCCLNALEFLQGFSLDNDEACHLIVVTGYRRRSVEKALEPCRTFIGRTTARLEMILVNNQDYRKGQFSSTKVGVDQVQEDSAFFISLADMPLIEPAHYSTLVPLLGKHDAVRPYSAEKKDRVPGHPVLHAYGLKKTILQCPDDWTVSRILKNSDVLEPSFEDSSWSTDIDSVSDYQNLSIPSQSPAVRVEPKG